MALCRTRLDIHALDKRNQPCRIDARTRKDQENFTEEDLFVVVQDGFMTETAKYADVVLPAATWGEKTGGFTNVDRTVHISHKAVNKPE